jgi:O-antigen ligase
MSFGGRRLAAAGGPTALGSHAACGETGVVGYNSATPWIAIVLLGLFAARITELVPAIAPLRPTLVVALAGSAWVLAHSAARKAADALSSPVLRAMIVYGTWAVLAAPFAIWPKHALLSAVPIFAPAILLCLILLLTAPTSRNLDLITFGFVCAVLVQMLGTMATGIIYRGGRLSGTDSLDPNDLASLAALTIPFAVAHARRGRGIVRLVALATVIIGVSVLMKTGSRGGTIAFAVCALVYVAGQPGYKRWIFAALFAIGMGVAWVVGPPEYRARMRTMTDLEEDYNETAYEGRNQIRQRAKEYFLADPVFGVGFANFEAAEGRRLRETYRRGKWSAPHNAYWQALAELGAVGGAAFFAMLLFAGRAAWRIWRGRLPNGRPNPLHRPEFLAALLAFSVAAYFLSHAYFWTMFGLVGMIALADRVADRVVAGGDVPGPAPTAVSSRRHGGFRSRRAEHR